MFLANLFCCSIRGIKTLCEVLLQENKSHFRVERVTTGDDRLPIDDAPLCSLLYITFLTLYHEHFISI